MTRTLTECLYKAAKEVKRTKQSSLPILNHILFRFHNGRIALTTHNLEEPLTAYASCIWNGEEWSTCIPARPFVDWLKVTYKFTTVLELSFDAARQVLHIKADNTRAEFKCLDSSEFPPTPPQ